MRMCSHTTSRWTNARCQGSASPPTRRRTNSLTDVAWMFSPAIVTHQHVYPHCSTLAELVNRRDLGAHRAVEAALKSAKVAAEVLRVAQEAQRLRNLFVASASH